MTAALVTLTELGRRLGYAPSTIREMYSTGKIRAEIEVTGHPKLSRFDVESVMQQLKPKP